MCDKGCEVDYTAVSELFLDSRVLLSAFASAGAVRRLFNKDLLLKLLLENQAGTSSTSDVERCDKVWLVTVYIDAGIDVCNELSHRRKHLYNNSVH